MPDNKAPLSSLATPAQNDKKKERNDSKTSPTTRLNTDTEEQTILTNTQVKRRHQKDRETEADRKKAELRRVP